VTFTHYGGDQSRGVPLTLVRSYSRPKYQPKGHRMWALVIFTIATTGASASTVTSIQFETQHLCLIAERQLESLAEPVVAEGLVRYAVVGTCVQVSEDPKKK
jgi:hypothetical protein